MQFPTSRQLRPVRAGSTVLAGPPAALDRLWPAVARAVLMIRHCECCQSLLAPGTAPCDTCGSQDLTKVASSGFGEIRTWTMVDCARPGARAEPVPCLLAVVALDDGPWICTWIDGEIAVGPDPHVRVQFHHVGLGERYPVFCRCGDAALAS